MIAWRRLPRTVRATPRACTRDGWSPRRPKATARTRSKEVIPPSAIEEQAKDNISWDPRIRTGRVTVAVASDGDVTLTGVVDSWEQARAAEADAVFAGATRVTNRLQLAAARDR